MKRDEDLEPEKTPLYKIVYNYHEEYEEVYPERYENGYGYFRTGVREVIQKYLNCGILEHGLFRICGYRGPCP